MIRRISASEFSTEFGRNAPAIITGALDSWHWAERWKPENLTAIAGNRQLSVGVAEDGKFSYSPTHSTSDGAAFAVKPMKFRDAVRAMLEPQDSGRVYVMQQSIPDRLPELMRNVIVPKWYPSRKTPAINLWLGRSTTTPLHYDHANNFYAQVYGTKRFVIFSPLDTDKLYPYPVDATMPHLSHVNPDEPDLVRYPHFADASAIEFVLQAGESLFLPAFWWHQVQATDMSASVSFWWAPSTSQCIDAPNSTRRLYAIYKNDRLAEIKSTWLRPSQIDFPTAAKLLLAAGRIWAACVVALAGFDELAREVCPLQRPSGCALPDLADDLREPCAIIIAKAAISARQAQVIKGVPLLAAACAQCDDGGIRADSVAELIETVAALRSKPN
jgi:hypothetical protein